MPFKRERVDSKMLIASEYLQRIDLIAKTGIEEIRILQHSSDSKCLLMVATKDGRRNFAKIYLQDCVKDAIPRVLLRGQEQVNKPRSAQSLIENEWSAWYHYRRTMGCPESFEMPRVKAATTNVLLLEWIEAVELRGLYRKRRDRALYRMTDLAWKAGQALATLHRSTGLVGGLKDTPLSDGSKEMSQAERELDFVSHLWQHSQGQVLSHGDYTCKNILYDGTALWIVDWEHFGLRSPMHDTVSMVASLIWEEMRTMRPSRSRFKRNSDAFMRGYGIEDRDSVTAITKLAVRCVTGPYIEQSLNAHGIFGRRSARMPLGYGMKRGVEWLTAMSTKSSD